MKLSIIVPVYNVEKYVERCLESLCGLEIENEIIVVNDGSTDNSLKAVQEFREKNQSENIIIIDQENRGLSEARNTGLRRACGEYVSFVDSDDFVSREEYRKIISRMAEERLDVLIGNGIYYFEENSPKNSVFGRSEKLREIGVRTGEEWLLALEKYGSYRAEVWDDIYRREFLLSNSLFFKPGRLHEDEVFTVEVLLSAQKVGYADIAFYNYFQSNSGSIMSKKSLKNHTDMIKNIEDLLEKSKNVKNRDTEKFIKNRAFSFFRRLLFDVYEDYRDEFEEIYRKYREFYKKYRFYENVSRKTRRKAKMLYYSYRFYHFRQSVKYRYKKMLKK